VRKGGKVVGETETEFVLADEERVTTKERDGVNRYLLGGKN